MAELDFSVLRTTNRAVYNTFDLIDQWAEKETGAARTPGVFTQIELARAKAISPDIERLVQMHTKTAPRRNASEAAMARALRPECR